MQTAQALAARNNAEWCDVICRAHGVATHHDAEAWAGQTRTPRFYPDAVTLVANPSVPDLLARVDNSAGCSIKDSYASLDLTDHGFRVLFEAEWIFRRATSPSPIAHPGPQWDVVCDAASLAAWEEAWRGEDGPVGLFRPAILAHPAVTVLAARSGGKVVSGAVLNRSDSVVGISNLFGSSGVTQETWLQCVARAVSLFPTLDLVGYELQEGLAGALDHGFKRAGPLRVWIRDHGPAGPGWLGTFGRD